MMRETRHAGLAEQGGALTRHRPYATVSGMSTVGLPRDPDRDAFPLADCEAPIPRRFEALARRWPERVAVRAGDRSTTYGALEARANRIAHAVLGARGPGEEAVAVLLAKDTALVAAFLGVLKAGKIHVPLDPAFPRERSRFMLHDSGAVLLLTDADTVTAARALAGPRHTLLDLDALEPALSEHGPTLPLTGDALATILYTSGSTGRPKGVLQNHRNTLHNVRNASLTLRVRPSDRISLLSSAAVFASGRDPLVALLNGASLALYDLAGLGVGPLGDWLRRERITLLNAVVTVFRHFVASLGEHDRFPTVRVVKSGSEALMPRDVEAFRRHFAEGCVLWAGFAATESSNVTQVLIDHAMPIATGGVSLGRPLEGMEIRIVDDRGAPLGPGEVGEIVVRSRYLALGYWRRPDLTAAAFRPDPDGGDRRLYHTGDLGRLTPGGDLEHLGRRDAMVKIRGQRVELGEIELALMALPGIKQAAVVARASAPGRAELVAYFAPREAPGPTPAEVRDGLAATLPASMIPARIVVLPALPSTPQGKVDRGALPEVDRRRPADAGPLVAPRTLVERELARIWATVLEVDVVGVTDRFLDLGGHSLLAGLIAARVRQLFKVKLPVATLLEVATVADMAVLVTAGMLEELDASRVEAMLKDLNA